MTTGSAKKLFGRATELWKSSAGNLALVFALLALPIISLAGSTIEIGRVVGTRAEVQAALDAATLAGAREYVRDLNLEDDQREQNAIRVAGTYFDQYIRAKPSLALLTDVTRGFTVESDNVIRATSSARMPTLIAVMVGINDVQIVSRSAARAGTPLPIEIALVLDNTGSMARYIDDLRTAGLGLVDAVTENAQSQRVKIAVVPYVTSVNVGKLLNGSMLDRNGDSTNHGKWFENRDVARLIDCNQRPSVPAGYNIVNRGGVCYIVSPSHVNIFDLYDQTRNVRWKGCVESQTAPYDTTDAAPDSSNPDTLYTPYFYPDVFRYANLNGTVSQDGFNDYVSDTLNYFSTSGPNAVRHVEPFTAGGVPPLSSREIAEYRAFNILKYSATIIGVENQPSTSGPNAVCPTEIVPLTDDYNKVRNALRQMNYWYNSGTNTQIGMAWGWKLLSPTPPFTEGAHYGEARKIVVLMTDGFNNIVTSSHPLNINQGAPTTSDYSGIGHLRDGHFATVTGAQAQTELSNRLAQTCTNAKAKGILIYTVLFNFQSADAEAFYRSCATSPAYFYQADNSSQLISVFRRIGESINQLQLIE